MKRVFSGIALVLGLLLVGLSLLSIVVMGATPNIWISWQETFFLVSPFLLFGVLAIWLGSKGLSTKQDWEDLR